MTRQLAARRPCASLLLSAAAAATFLMPSLAAHIEYDRAAIAAGEVWRLVSAHWAHYSLDHLVWDVLAFGALGLACERSSRSRFLTCVGASALVISLAVWVSLPHISAYRGLSGVDSALCALLIVELVSEARRLRKPAQMAAAIACAGAFLAKICFEVLTGSTLFVRGLDSGAAAVPLAHVAGTVCGLLIGLESLRGDGERQSVLRSGPHASPR